MSDRGRALCHERKRPMITAALGTRWRSAPVHRGAGKAIRKHQHFRNAKRSRYGRTDESDRMRNQGSKEAGIAIHDRRRSLLLARFRANCNVDFYRNRLRRGNGPNRSCTIVWRRNARRRAIRSGRQRKGNCHLHVPRHRLGLLLRHAWRYPGMRPGIGLRDALTEGRAARCY